MKEYFFDVETCINGNKPNPLNDRIITIQYQLLDGYDQPNGSLKILTEWEEGSEKRMLEKFKAIFVTESPFDFIPVGVNLYGYDLIVLLLRLEAHGLLDTKPIEFFRDRPVIDIKPILVIMNQGQFKGYTNIIKKQHGGNIKGWYENREYEKIIDYITQEAQSFIKAYRVLKEQLPRIVEKFNQ